MQQQQFKILPTLSCIAFLAACGSNEATPEPGEYQQSMKITALEISGLEGDAKAEMIRQMEAAGNSIGAKFCMSAEQGESQWKEAASQMTSLLGGNCETVRDEGSANWLDLELQCKATVQGDVTVTMTGTAKSDGYDSQIAFDMKNPENGEMNKLAMNIGAKRLGDCAS